MRSVWLIPLGLFVPLVALELFLRVSPQQDLQTNDPYHYTEITGPGRAGMPLGFYRELYPHWLDKRGYYKKSDGDIFYFNDQYGARWKEAAVRKLDPSALLIVGDSFSYGFGVRFEDSFAALLEQKGHKTINLARPDIDAVKALATYREFAPKIRHRGVLYGLHLNDLIEFPTSMVVTNELLGSFGARHSRLVDFVLRKWELSYGRKKKIAYLVSNAARDTEFFRENFLAIEMLRDEANAHKKPFLVALFPIFVDVQKKSFEPLYAALREQLTKAKIPFVDLTDFAAYRDEDLWIMPYDQHPNELAHAIFARKLESYFRETGWPNGAGAR